MEHKNGGFFGLLTVGPAFAALPVLFQERRSGLPLWWFGALVILVLFVLLLWWLLRDAGKKAAPSAPDDLAKIEGIGPKIAGLLQAAGITTFAQLAKADVARLHQILKDADITIADPTTWPEQARLASAGRWDELQALQDDLKGGRRE